MLRPERGALRGGSRCEGGEADGSVDGRDGWGGARWGGAGGAQRVAVSRTVRATRRGISETRGPLRAGSPSDPSGASLVYDIDKAVQFGSEATGQDPEVVFAILCARDRYLLGMGIVPEDENVGPKAAEIRRMHPDLFPVVHMDNRRVVPRLEEEFILRDSGVGADVVRRVMGADYQLMFRLGILVGVSKAEAPLVGEAVGVLATSGAEQASEKKS